MAGLQPTFFESFLALLVAAIVLTQVSRRTTIPYPSMLALAGIAVGFVPGTPHISIDPVTMLALFVAPALMDAAFDFPAAAIRRLWRPLVALVFVAVMLTTTAVAWVGWALAGLPIAAAIALGAIVAPPDAAAASAVLRTAALPRRTMEVLKGESLLNDGTALLIFGSAVAIQLNQGFSLEIGVRFALAIPGGIILGIVLALLYLRYAPLVRGTLGGSLLEFVYTFCVWILAERLGLSAVLCVVAYAMTLARVAGSEQPARVRIHSYAVWETVVFLLNVVAFLLMGMHGRSIIDEMPAGRLTEAMIFTGIVIATVILVRIVWVFIYNWLSAALPSLSGRLPPASWGQILLVGWCGMRGLVTLATALALPVNFPHRDLIVLAAFGVVIATVVFQGMTIAPLIRWLGIDDHEAQQKELARTRRLLANVALHALARERAKGSADVRKAFALEREAVTGGERAAEAETRRALTRKGLDAQRRQLGRLHAGNKISEETFLTLQQELDWKELSLSTADSQTIEEA